MLLKNLFLETILLGYFDCSIENNVILCDGVNHVPKHAPDYEVAELYLFNIMFPDKDTFKEGVMVSFKQDGDNIIFGYRKLRFTLVSADFHEIIVTDGFSKFFIRQIKP